jgi:hypothetical protein
MTILLWAALWLQVLLPPVVAYTTADPVDPNRLGLATPDGRYAIELSSGCEIGELQRVYAWPVEKIDSPSSYLLAPIDDAGAVVLRTLAPDGQITSRLCVAQVDAKMANTPCFGDGVCDVRYEIPD